MPLNTIFNTWLHRYHRFIKGSGRLFRALPAKRAVLALPLLYTQLLLLSWRCQRQDGIRQALGQPLIGCRYFQRWPWVSLELLCQCLLPFVPFARKHRCLLMSLFAAHHLRQRKEWDAKELRFVLGAMQKTGRDHRFHAAIHYKGVPLVDLDPNVIRHPIFIYPLTP